MIPVKLTWEILWSNIALTIILKMDIIRRMAFYSKITLILIWQIQIIHMTSFSNMELLYNNLTTGHNKYLRPVKDYSTTTVITIAFHLLNVQEINAVDGTMSVSGYFSSSWNDENLVWTPTDYDNTVLITLPHDQIWKPPLVNANSAKEFKIFGLDGSYVQVYYNGTVYWLPGQALEFKCSIDTTYFPFDAPECEFEVIAWGYGMAEISFISSSTTVNTGSYTANGEWDLIQTSATADNTGTPTAKFKLYYKRRPLFLLITLVLPVFFMALLNICVFILPEDSGERIGFSITLLLAVVVFMTIAQGLLPATAEPRLSAICIILLVDMMMSGMIVASVIVSSWFYYKPDDEKIPDWIQKVVRFKLYCCRNTKSNKVNDVKIRIKDKPLDVDSLSTTWDDTENVEKVTWQKVARFWDILSLVLYILGFIGGNLFFIIDVSTGT